MNFVFCDVVRFFFNFLNCNNFFFKIYFNNNFIHFHDSGKMCINKIPFINKIKCNLLSKKIFSNTPFKLLFYFLGFLFSSFDCTICRVKTIPGQKTVSKLYFYMILFYCRIFPKAVHRKKNIL